MGDEVGVSERKSRNIKAEKRAGKERRKEKEKEKEKEEGHTVWINELVFG